ALIMAAAAAGNKGAARLAAKSFPPFCRLASRQLPHSFSFGQLVERLAQFSRILAADPFGRRLVNAHRGQRERRRGARRERDEARRGGRLASLWRCELAAGFRNKDERLVLLRRFGAGRFNGGVRRRIVLLG